MICMSSTNRPKCGFFSTYLALFYTKGAVYRYFFGASIIA